MHKFTEEQEEKLDTLVGQFNSRAEWLTDYYTSNDENPIADYCTWGWKEGDTSELASRALSDAWDEDLQAAAEFALSLGLDKDQLGQLLGETSELHYENSFGRNAGCVFSASIGEIEDQICKGESDGLCEAYMALNAEERDYVNRRADCPIKSGSGDWCLYIYTHDDGYWYLKASAETLLAGLVDQGHATQEQVDAFLNAKAEA